MEVFDDDDLVGDDAAAVSGGTPDVPFDPSVTAEYRRGSPVREPTFVPLENVDQTVGEIIGLLKGDIGKFDDKFLDEDEDDDALFRLIDDQFACFYKRRLFKER